MNSRIFNAYKGFDFALRLLTNVVLVALVAVVMAAVVVRYFGLFEGSLHWANELARFSMIWMVMLGSAIAFGRNAHVAIDFLPKSVPVAVARAIGRLANLLTFAFVTTLAWQGFALSLATMRQVSPALNIPMGYIYLAIAVGSAVMAIQALLMAVFPNVVRGAGTDAADDETPPG